MIVGALACDAAIGNLQEKVMREHHVAAAEIVFFSYAMGSVVIFLGLLASGSLWPAIQFASDNAAHVYGWAVSFSVTGYVGVLLVLALVDGFGALVAVTGGCAWRSHGRQHARDPRRWTRSWPQ